MTQYRLQDPRKGLIGPVRLETVRDLVEAGVLQDDVWVSRDGGPFLPIKSFNEIVPEAPPALPQKATYAGDIGKNSFFKIFYRFHVTKASGLLVVQDAAQQKNIYLEAGDPRFITSNMSHERLGEFLVQRGRIDREEQRRALASMKLNGVSFGQMLSRMGLMDQHQIYLELREQQALRLVDLCTWEAGRYLFFDDLVYEGERIDLSLRSAELLMRAAREMQERTYIRRLGVRINEPAHRANTLALEALDLSPYEKSIYAAIDELSTPNQIVQRVAENAAQRRAALMMFYVLWEVEAVTFG